MLNWERLWEHRISFTCSRRDILNSISASSWLWRMQHTGCQFLISRDIFVVAWWKNGVTKGWKNIVFHIIRRKTVKQECCSLGVRCTHNQYASWFLTQSWSSSVLAVSKRLFHKVATFHSGQYACLQNLCFRVQFQCDSISISNASKCCKHAYFITITGHTRDQQTKHLLWWFWVY